MTDIGGPAEDDPGAVAPIADDAFGVAPEHRIIVRNLAHPPHPDRPAAADVRIARDVEHHPVDAIFVRRNIFDEEVGAGEVGLERGAEQVRQYGEVERHRPPARNESRLQCPRLALDDPVERAMDGRVPAIAKHVLHHWPMSHAEPSLVERSKHETAIRIAHDRLVPRRIGQLACCGRGDPVRAIAPASEPQGPNAGIGHHLAQCRQSLIIWAGEMPCA